ncbi:MAG: hypothetical protein F7C38_05150 [Desulfurococcales archaeon]|nr:hypothetical protein [Desulfurococcales archaeon]
MDSRTLAIAGVLAVLLVAVGVALYFGHHGGQCGGLEVAHACFLTNKIIIDIEGECSKPVTLKFYDDSGNLKAEVEVPVGRRVVVPVTPNLAPGEYTVEFYVDGKRVHASEARVYLAPYLVNAKAIAWPNGTITIDYTSNAPPCLKDYGITTVLVRVNGTLYNETGLWRPTDTIRIDLNTTITPDTMVTITMIDSLGQVYNNVPLARPI